MPIPSQMDTYQQAWEHKNDQASLSNISNEFKLKMSVGELKKEKEEEMIEASQPSGIREFFAYELLTVEVWEIFAWVAIFKVVKCLIF
jgi:hypothetical protein